MYLFKDLIILSVSVGLVLASAAESGSTHTLEVVHRRGNSGPAGFREALLRHGELVPWGVEEAAKDPSILIDGYMKAVGNAEWSTKRQSKGSTQALPISKENGYYASVTIGESKLDLLVDTGSSDLWVYSQLQLRNATTGRKLYNTSSGTRLPGYTWRIEYGDGTAAAGIVYRDSVVVGDATATSQAIEAATSTSGNAIRFPASGILGLAYKRLNSVKPEKQSTLWQNLNPTLKNPVFATDFYYNAPGTLDFGYIDPKKYFGPITYARTTKPNGFSHSFWDFNFTSFDINGTKIPAHHYRQFPTALLDTGTSFVRIHAKAAAAYWGQVKGAERIAEQWVYPCHRDTPDLGIEIGGRNFYIPGHSVRQPLGHSVCYGGIQGAGNFDGYDFIGDPFINGNFIVFDGPNHRIGFAHKRLHKLAHC